jgi:hypothetical protein
MGSPQDPQARAKEKKRRRVKEQRLKEKKAAAEATKETAKKLARRCPDEKRRDAHRGLAPRSFHGPAVS